MYRHRFFGYSIGPRGTLLRLSSALQSTCRVGLVACDLERSLELRAQRQAKAGRTQTNAVNGSLIEYSFVSHASPLCIASRMVTYGGSEITWSSIYSFQSIPPHFLINRDYRDVAH